MQGAQKRSVIVLLLAVAAVFVAAPATVLAKPKPVKYVLVSHTKGCLVTLNAKTGTLTFKAEKGRYGKFTVVVKHGKKKTVYRFTVKKPKLKSQPPIVIVVKSPGTPPVIIPVPISLPGQPAPTPPSPTPTPIPSPPPRSAPHNFAPVLHVDGGTISWAAQKGADAFHGAISTDARGTADRTTTYTNLSLATSWTPAPPACGQTRYYGVASEGNAGEQWTANEVSIAGPVCGPPRNLTKPTISGILGDTQTLTLHPGTWANSTSQTESWELCCPDDLVNCDQGEVVSNPSNPDVHFVDDGEVGDSIAVIETATGPGGTSNVMVETAPVPAPPPTLDFRDTQPPSISSPSPGQVMPGQTVTLQQGHWAWAFGGLTDDWQVCFAAEKCVSLNPQPTGDTYVVTGAYVGWFIQVVETAHGNGTASFTTVPTISIVG
jgi:hypothetical protein